MMRIGAWVAFAILGSSPAMASPAMASTFYEGKTISFVVGLAPGGGYDVYARLLARYFPRYVPGNPKVIVENRPGAASATAATYVYRIAPKDGTVVGVTLEILPLYQKVFAERVGFDMSKVHWIGNMATMNSMIAVSDKSPVKTVSDMRKYEASLGSTGVLSLTYIVPALLNSLHGAKFKIVMGYRGTSEIDLAIERGELHGAGGQWTRYVSGRPQWIASGKIMPLLQFGLDDDPLMKSAPQLSSLAENDRQRAIYRIISSAPRFARAMWVAPEVPADRVDILRKAFAQALKDPGFLADAAKGNLDISPTSVSDVQSAAADIAATPQQHLQMLRELLKDHK
jgi:tripartite-type tricarboxylate transporter receptor subunit TctC